jgi:predicted outer membrane repeat protein
VESVRQELKRGSVLDLRAGRELLRAARYASLFLMLSALTSGLAAQEAPDVAGAETASSAPRVIEVPRQIGTLTAALAAVPNGGVVELAAGHYNAPTTGFKISNPRRSFTVRAAQGAVVTLEGEGKHPVMVLRNNTRALGGLIVFQNIRFMHGGGGNVTTSAGVTVDQARARFSGCTFEDNVGAKGIDGGGMKVRNGSVATFQNSTFRGNSSTIAGGALSIWESTVVIRGGSFVNNQANLLGSDPTSHGGAITMSDGTLTVTSVLFQANQANWVGGAIYAVGNWTATPSVAHSQVTIASSTFAANSTTPVVTPAGPPSGGAIHVEDQTTLQVSGSLLTGNLSEYGGAIDSFRALVHVDHSVFQGNGGLPSAVAEAVGGAICVLDNGTTPSPRPAGVTVTDSLLQGTSAGGAPVVNAGGCLLVGGDEYDLYGLGGLPASGTLDSNRSPIAIRGSVFADCSAQASQTFGGGTGGAISATLVALTLENSLIVGSNASGNGMGGALFLNGESDAAVTGTVFAGNSSEMSGGAIFAAGSHLDVSSSSFLANSVADGNSSPLSASRGAALYTIPMGATATRAGSGDMSGTVSQSLFSANAGLDVWEVDAGGSNPINSVQYEQNRFYAPFDGGRMYIDTISDPGRSGSTVSGLNALVVRRSGGSSTVKAPIANEFNGSAPAVGTLIAFPPEGVPGSQSAPTLAYAWSGMKATLNGENLTDHEGVIFPSAPGTYDLVVDGAKVATADVVAP